MTTKGLTTPGPWTCDENGLVAGFENRPQFAYGKTKTGEEFRCPSQDIFDAEEWPFELYDEAMANAHLIAAAKDLLAAAKAAAPALLAFTKEATSYEQGLLLAAIKKAEDGT